MLTEKYDVVILGGGNAGMGVTVPTVPPAFPSQWSRGGISAAPARTEAAPPRRCLLPQDTPCTRSKGRLPTAFPWASRGWIGPPLIDRERQMISHIPGALSRLMADRGVEVVRGEASFVGPNTISIGDRIIEARHIVIATGSKPRSLPIGGAEHMITSDDVLSEREQPREVVFIGGIIIALELRHVYARARTKVTILELLARLPQETMPTPSRRSHDRPTHRSAFGRAS
jgi:glutathione reductase (NADPH)